MKIGIALSGGIDSSAAAWLLKEQGHQVTGFTMKHFDDHKMGFASDQGISAVIKQAKAVCDFIDIPHQVIDLTDYFRDSVMNNFILEYKNGRTPNPCTLCNRVVKWGRLLDAVLALGCERMATGHYIILQQIKNKIHLFRSHDQNKDQSYMLWQLSQQQLANTIFPLADFTKNEARQLITEANIPVAVDQESQEVCFIKDHYQEFLKKHIKLIPGNIVLEDGSIIGRHYGLPLYTIGQRKGLHTSLNVPLFVKELDTGSNQLIVTADNNALAVKRFAVNNVNWIADILQPDWAVQVQIRYNSLPLEVRELRFDGDFLQVELNKPARAVTPGQSAVFYHQNELLGGGIITDKFLW